MTPDLLLLGVLILLSGFFASAELAFVVANKLKIELRARKNKLAAKSAQYFINNSADFFSTILISNNVINIAFSSLSALVLSKYFGFNEYQIMIISTLIILFIGELIPKFLGSEFSDSYVNIVAIPLRIFSFILYPFVFLTSKISDFITNTESMNEANISRLFDREDIQSLLEESSEAGKLNEDDSDVITKIMDLGEQRIYECMTPRTDIIGVEIDEGIPDALGSFIESGYSKLPVFDDNLDNIKGIILAYDMFKSPKSIKEVIRDVIFVPESKRSIEMLNEFLDKGISFAVVVDEFGGTAGIVTVEDIIEELFGEIRDEYDIEENVCKRLGDDEYIISGKVEIDFINEKFDLRIPEGDYETIAGYITAVTGRIPARGELLEIAHFKIHILAADKTKISMLKVVVIPEKMPEE